MSNRQVRRSVATIVLAVVLLLGGAFVGQGLALFVGSRLHSVLPFGGVRTAGPGCRCFCRGPRGLHGPLAARAVARSAPQWISQLTTDSVIAGWVSNETHDHGLSPPNTLRPSGASSVRTDSRRSST